MPLQVTSQTSHWPPAVALRKQACSPANPPSSHLPQPIYQPDPALLGARLYLQAGNTTFKNFARDCWCTWGGWGKGTGPRTLAPRTRPKGRPGGEAGIGPGATGGGLSRRLAAALAHAAAAAEALAAAARSLLAFSVSLPPPSAAQACLPSPSPFSAHTLPNHPTKAPRWRSFLRIIHSLRHKKSR